MKYLVLTGIVAALAVTGCQSSHVESNTKSHHSIKQHHGKKMHSSPTIIYPSQYDFATTEAKLKKTIEASPAQLFAVVPHSVGAQKANMKLNPTTLFIFGNPAVGTPVLQANQEIALELPLRVLVWQDDNGQVKVSRQNLTRLAKVYGIDADTVAKLDQAADRLIRSALE